MLKAGDADDFEELALLAHWLKGSAGSFGLHMFTKVAGELEEAAKSRTARDIPVLLGKVRNLSSRIELFEVEDSQE